MGIAFGLLTSLSIGLSDLFGRKVVATRGPVPTGVVMQFVAIFTSIAALGVVDSAFDPGDFGIGLASGLGMGVGLWGYFGGLQRSSAAVVAPIVAAISTVVPYAYALVRGADPTSAAVVGAACALGGLVLITIDGGRVAHVASGIRWGVVSGSGFAFGSSVVLEASEASGSWPAVGQRVSAFALMVVVARAIRVPAVPPVGVRAAALIAGVLAGCSTVCYLVGVQADATAAVVTASLFPVVSVVVGRFVYGDVVLARQLVGLAVVLGGVVLVATG